MAIQRENSSCILGTIPDSEGLDQVFDFIDYDDTIRSITMKSLR